MYIRADKNVVHTLCVEYVKGDSISRDILLRYFEPIINTFHRMLTTGNMYNYSFMYKTFAASFVKKEDWKRGSRNTLSDAIHKTSSILMSSYCADEVYNEIIVIMLDTLQRFADKDRESSNMTFIYKTFVYNLSTRIKKMINSVYAVGTVFIYGDLLSYIEEIDAHDDMVLDMLRGEMESLFTKELIDDSRLCLLDPIEINILIQAYVYKRKDSEIGEDLYMHRCSVLNKRHAALMKLGICVDKPVFCDECGAEMVRPPKKIGRPPKKCDACQKPRRRRK